MSCQQVEDSEVPQVPGSISDCPLYLHPECITSFNGHDVLILSCWRAVAIVSASYMIEAHYRVETFHLGGYIIYISFTPNHMQVGQQLDVTVIR